MYLKGKKRERERDLCLEVVIWPCFYGLYQFLKVNICSKKNKYISLLEETRIKNFCRKKYRESRVVLLKVQDAKKKYNGKLRGYF